MRGGSRATGPLARWAAWRWRFPIEIALAFLVGLLVTMSVARGLREAPAPATQPFKWDEYIATVAGIYVLESPPANLDNARARLAALRSDSPIDAVRAAAMNPPGTGAAQDRNRRNIEELRDALVAAGPGPAPRATPPPAAPPIDAEAPSSLALNLLAIIGVVVGIGLVAWLLTRLIGGWNASRRAAVTRRRPRPPEPVDADPGDPGRSPRPGDDSRRRPQRPTDEPIGDYRPRPDSPRSPGSGQRSTRGNAVRCRYTFGTDDYEESQPITDPVTGEVIGGCGVSGGLALSDGDDHDAFVAFSIWVYGAGTETTRRTVRGFAVISRWALSERRGEIEQWALGLRLDGVDVAQPGLLRVIETERFHVDVVLEELAMGTDPTLPVGSYFDSFGVRFDVRPAPVGSGGSASPGHR